MYSRIEGRKVVIALEFSTVYDTDSGGYLVCEKDGPPNLNHQITWGPMPHYLVDAFIRERGDVLTYVVKKLTEKMFADRVWS